MRDYMLVSPSLDGILKHDSIVYEGLRRPESVLRVFDGPAKSAIRTPAQAAEERKMLEQYFHDLYGVFMKKLSHFVVGSEVRTEETLKLQAMLQEMVKVKQMVRDAAQSEP